MLKNKHVFSFQTDAEVADKVGQLTGFCASNGCRASDGLIMRALLMKADCDDPGFIGLVRAQLDKEKAARRAANAENVGKGAAGHGTLRQKAKRR